ncbi:hypothetical protein STCU_11451 [Strigomonas culicis]|uniref:Uncharacterized protein n=1 Tax=Strigomonas culicis TaxID=28005 RepID=S9TIQ9_9TRYP|nr:hypothetical protein STCU_11451 [Strigomonas culicis]|eukprot:EPY16253.1 hypothetical protein STCU_11451 [Strigomonas culicis]
MGNTNQTEGPKSFFCISNRYGGHTNNASRDDDLNMASRKRVRTDERAHHPSQPHANMYMTNEDGTTVLRTTAIHAFDDTNNNTNNNKFDFFATQEDAFLNDINGINETQKERLVKKKQRMHKDANTKQPIATHYAHPQSKSDTAILGKKSSSKTAKKGKLHFKY